MARPEGLKQCVGASPASVNNPGLIFFPTLPEQIENNLAAIAAPLEEGGGAAKDFGVVQGFVSEFSFQESLGVLFFTLLIANFTDDLPRQGRPNTFRFQLVFDSLCAVASAFDP
jgi:hypothetical protein